MNACTHPPGHVARSLGGGIGCTRCAALIGNWKEAGYYSMINVDEVSAILEALDPHAHAYAEDLARTRHRIVGDLAGGLAWDDLTNMQSLSATVEALVSLSRRGGLLAERELPG